MSSRLSCEQTAEDSRAELEAFDERGAGALNGRILVSPRSQVVFRPEEVDRGSERVGDLAAIVGPLADPEHHARSFWLRSVRRRRELERLPTMMAVRPDLDRLPDHRRDAERVHGTAGKSLETIWQPHNERGRQRREGIGDVDVIALDADQVVVIQRSERPARRGVSKPRRDLLERNRPATVDEQLENASELRGLARGASSQPATPRVARGKLLGGLDLEARHSRTSLSVHRLLPCQGAG